jgi:glucokinase
MSQTIGALVTEHIAVGLVEDHRLVGAIRRFPATQQGVSDTLESIHANEIVERIAQEIEGAGEGRAIKSVGVGFPGVNRDGLIEESPNLKQAKGLNLGQDLSQALRQRGIEATVRVLNDADALAAGIAATKGELDQLVRVWFLGVGVGLGRYPDIAGVGEGGHSVVSLDPKEKFCGCGGVGHLEGIMGHRAMRLRFLDLEPEEVFQEAAAGDQRCSEFVLLWHRALAAATSSTIHYDGPGKFYISGPNARFVQIGLLNQYVRDMVKMSTLQNNTFEVIDTSDDVALIGAAVIADQTSGS